MRAQRAASGGFPAPARTARPGPAREAPPHTHRHTQVCVCVPAREAARYEFRCPRLHDTPSIRRRRRRSLRLRRWSAGFRAEPGRPLSFPRRISPRCRRRRPAWPAAWARAHGLRRPGGPRTVQQRPGPGALRASSPSRFVRVGSSESVRGEHPLGGLGLNRRPGSPPPGRWTARPARTRDSDRGGGWTVSHRPRPAARVTKRPPSLPPTSASRCRSGGRGRSCRSTGEGAETVWY